MNGLRKASIKNKCLRPFIPHASRFPVQMVTIKPFCGWFYDIDKMGDMRKLVSPPHDVISDEERDKLYSVSEHNIVRLLLPKGGYSEASDFLEKISSEKIICPDEKASYYLYEQEFKNAFGIEKRAGILALVLAEPFGKNILAHEKVFPEKVEDRLNLLTVAKADTSPIFGMYADKSGSIADIVGKTKQSAPKTEFIDESDTINRLWKIEETEDVTRLFGEEKIIIADGHHRYTAASELARRGGPKYTLMYLVDINDPGLRILPTHRFIKDDSFDTKKFLSDASSKFDIRPVDDISQIEDILADSGRHTFGLHSKDGSYILTLKDKSLLDDGDPNKHPLVRNLDVSVLNDIILPKIANVAPDSVDYAKHADDVIRLIGSGLCKAAFMLRHSDIGEIIDIVECNELMPHKSTYFHPKPMAGVIIRKIEDHEA